MAEDLDTILERATIKFPKPLDKDHAIDLLYFIEHKLPGRRIDYIVESHHSIGKDVEKSIREIKISGKIVAYHRNFAFADFRLNNEEVTDDPSYLSSLQFDLVPSWNLSDYGTDRLELWSKVKKLVAEYFED